MEGTSPDVPALAAICARHGALLLLDEAHALGVLGPGAAAWPTGWQGCTWSAAPSARPSAAAAPSWPATPCWASGCCRAAAPSATPPPWRRPWRPGPWRPWSGSRPGPEAAADLLARAARWRDALAAAGWPRPAGEGPILPLLVGDDGAALALQAQLEHAGLLAWRSVPPPCRTGTARLRLVLRQDLPDGTLQRLIEALGPAPVPALRDDTHGSQRRPGDRHARLGRRRGHWDPWRQASAALGWRWTCGERGYGGRTPLVPRWSGAGRRVVIGHSLGLHLLPADVLAGADAVVLLASFGRFVPPGREGRRLRTALAGMAAELADGPGEAEAALRAQAAAAALPGRSRRPRSRRAAAAGPGRRAGGSRRAGPACATTWTCWSAATACRRAFPPQARVLIVEAEADRIVPPRSRALLREALPAAEVLRLEGAGHSLLRCPVIAPVLEWIQSLPEP